MSQQSKHWANMNEAGVMAGIRFLYLSYQLTGRWGFRICLFPVVCYFFLRRGAARRASRDYLERLQARYQVFDRDVSAWLVLRHFLSFSETTLEKILALSGKIQPDVIGGDGMEAISGHIRNREGGLMVVGHLGNLELSRALAKYQVGLRLTVLVHTRHAENFNRMLKRINPEAQIDLIQVTEIGPSTAIMLSTRVQAGEFVVIAGDRTPVGSSEHTVEADFLGAPAPFPIGPWLLAGLLKCPVYLVFCLRRNKRYELHLEHFSDGIAMPRKQRQEIFADCAQRFAARLEHHCQRAPLQWFNFYDFWQSRREQ